MGRSRTLAQTELSEKSFPLTWQVLRRGLNDTVAPSIVAGLWTTREPYLARIAAIGQRRVFPKPQPVKTDTDFDLASLTKVIGTASFVANLVQRKFLSWDTPIRAIFPDYQYAKMTVGHLLSHTSGLPAWIPFWEKLREEFSPDPLYKVPVEDRQESARRILFGTRSEHPLGEKAIYSDLTFIMLGFIIEEIMKLPLDQALERHLWDPMGLRGFYFRRVIRSLKWGSSRSIAATEDSEWRGGMLQGQVHDDNCWAMGGYAGHAGVYGCAHEILEFVQRLYSGFLSREILKQMWTRVREPKGCSRTLGWETPTPRGSTGRAFSKMTVGHLGYTGTSLWIDLENGFAVTLLTNRVHPSRKNEKIKKFRPLFHEAIVKDLMNLRYWTKPFPL